MFHLCSLLLFTSDSLSCGRKTRHISLLLFSKITYSSCPETPAALDIRLACSTSRHPVQLPCTAATMWVISSCARPPVHSGRCGRTLTSPRCQKPKTSQLEMFCALGIPHRLRRYCEKSEDVPVSATLPQLSLCCTTCMGKRPLAKQAELRVFFFLSLHGKAL